MGQKDRNFLFWSLPEQNVIVSKCQNLIPKMSLRGKGEGFSGNMDNVTNGFLMAD